MIMRAFVFPVYVAVLCAGLAMAEETPSQHHMHTEHSGMDAGAEGTFANAPSSLAFKAASQKMHESMTSSFTGDADVDFVKGMIPHHQGAIDMARIELQYGKDPEIRKLAQGVIKAQEAEIAEMTAWLAKHTK